MKSLAKLLVGCCLLMGLGLSQGTPNYQLQNPSFETGDLSGWTVTGNAFAVSDDNRWSWGGPFNQDGKYHVWGFKKSGDDGTGSLQSSNFVLSGTGQISFLASGGINLEHLYVALIRAKDNKELFRATGNGDEAYRVVEWDASEYLGEEMFFKVVDEAKGGWGHINIDGIRVFTPTNTLANINFSKEDLSGWSGDLEAFQVISQNSSKALQNRSGQTGRVRSTQFRLGGQGVVSFKLSGSQPSSIQLIRSQDQKVLFEESPNSSVPTTISWDASSVLDQDLYLQVQAGNAGQIAVSNLEVFQPRSSATVTTSIPNSDFSSLAGWTELGKAFKVQQNILTSTLEGNASLGTLYSSVFRVGNSGIVRLKVAGANNPAAVYVALVRASDDRTLFKASGNNADTFREIQWDASDYQDSEVYLKIVDQSSKGSLGIKDLEINLPYPAGFIRKNIPNPDFETGDLTGWMVQGQGFTVSQSRTSSTGELFSQQGKYHLVTESDNLAGSLQSQPFTLSGSGKISFKISGSNDPKTYVALERVSDNQELFKATSNGSETYQTVIWDASSVLGKKVYLKIVDDSQQAHINVDDFRVYQGLIAAWNFDEAKGKTVTEQISGQADNIEYVFNQAKFKPSSFPEWRTGIAKSSLLFDGYSNFIEHIAPLTKLSDAFTLEAWVAPRNFEWGDGQQMSAIINQHNPTTQEGFILGVGRHGRWGLMMAMGGRWQMLQADASGALRKNEWAHIAATFDRDQHQIRLYFNGRDVGTLKTPVNTGLSLSSEALWLGKHNAPVIINSVFPVNMFSGLMDQVKIFNVALTETEIRRQYRSTVASFPNRSLPEAQTAFNRNVYQGDRYRPSFHFIPPGHWMNEPHAPVFFGGQYHLFYQQNVQGPYWHNIQWGHQVSKDLVHWRDVPAALSPSFGTAAPDGVWSGSAFKTATGEPLLFFTAGDDSVHPNQSMAIARAFDWQHDTDLKEWQMPKSISLGQKEKLEVGKNLKVKFGDFRDPFVWREGATWFALVGSGVQTLEGKDVGGTALLYSSSDLAFWNYRGTLMTGNAAKFPATGQVWELPVFLPIGKNTKGQQKYVFMVNPAFAAPSPYQIKYVWYWIGSWDAKQAKFQPDQLEPKLFDYGEHFTGPSGLRDQQGRTIIFSIAQDKRSEQDHYDAGWAHNAGLPLQVFLNAQNDLGVKPIKETQNLRNKKLLELQNTNITAANAALKNIQGNQLEIELEISLPKTQTGLCVLCSPDKKEATLLAFDPSNKNILIDRSNSSLSRNLGVQGGVLPMLGKSLKWHVFLDKSMIEAYVNDSKAITSRAYPTQPNAKGIQLFGDARVTVRSLKVWSMGSAYK